QPVNFTVGERPRLAPWHGAPNVIKESRRERPEIRDRLLRFHILDRIAAGQSRVRATFAVFTVAHGAFCGVDAGSVRWRTAAGRETRTIRLNVDVPGRDLGRIERLSKIWPLSEGCARTNSDREDDNVSSKLTHIHASPPRCARSPMS